MTKQTKYMWTSAAFALGLVLGGVNAATALALDITGAGATFPYPIYSKWAAAYYKETDVGINYQSMGSGGGIRQIRVGTVDFGASDKPLTAAELADGDLMQFPMVMGGVVPVVNLPGIEAGGIRLSGDLLAKLFLGEIRQWNDPAIVRLNPDIALPSLPVTVVHRSDSAGTTFLFTHYLGSVSEDWKQKAGVGVAVAWPTGLGGKGNEGVASYVKTVKGAIGYVELAYSQQSEMAYVVLQNQAGRFVSPSIASFQAAAANADWADAPGFFLVLTNQPGDESWPITGASFILMRKKQVNLETAQKALKFFSWAYSNGDEMAIELHYVPMPKPVVELVEAAWAKEIRGPADELVWNAGLQAR